MAVTRTVPITETVPQTCAVIFVASTDAGDADTALIAPDATLAEITVLSRLGAPDSPCGILMLTQVSPSAMLPVVAAE
ncbi:hypothetical protein RSM1_14680 [Methylobacterium radiotolerans]|nr:hypothetical protein RSM1_14680 [Methylobacterium radiotolerans]